ncbi:sugar O-acetyltransferase [Nemorincola caseinilytica]|uniref:Sugar O-acetyltransferase n=1 Tax=Nemorincola caseinilytica TaxID=2054315 RepID=A0ABP8NBE9_9BACT
MAGRYKIWLFGVLAVLVFAPMAQHGLGLYKSRPLDGAVTIAPDAQWSMRAWWNGEYQDAKNKYLNDNMGFRPDLVRLNNEIDNRLFRRLHANNVVMGRDGCLYEQGYIDEYTGLEYQKDSIIRRQLIRLRRVQDTLEQLGKTFVFVEAASKAYYYPDKFPRGIRNRRYRTATTYGKHIALCDSLGIQHIDANAWFASQRGKDGKDKLFSLTGTHWSLYGSLLVADSLSRYIELRQNILLPSLYIQEMRYSDVPRYTDDDIARGLNLLSRPPRETLCYPEYDFMYSNPRTTRPKMIFIGDSFLWTMADNKYMRSVSEGWEFWYYNSEVWTAKSGDKPYPMDTYDWKTSLQQADVVVAMYGTINLKTFWDQHSFIEMMYTHFYGNQ